MVQPHNLHCEQVASTTDIAVFVGNVRQEPTTAYTVNGTTLDFGGNALITGLDMYVLHIGGTYETFIIPVTTLSLLQRLSMMQSLVQRLLQ